MNFIAGSLCESARTYGATSPLDGADLPGRFRMASLDDVDAAMQAAAAAAGGRPNLTRRAQWSRRSP
jgi:acyl-CoA reductase-like NAD-dependent aldehyde dehydrogenase